MTPLVFERIRTKRTADAPALDGVSLEVAGGEIVALAGPRGGGKSALLRVAAGLVSPTDGRVLVGGADVTRLAPRDRDVALTLPTHPLYHFKTVRENLTFAPKLNLDADELARRAEAAADELGLAPYLDRSPNALSETQRRRVAVARAFVRRPAAYLFDGLLDGLDAQERTELRLTLVRILRKRGAAAIVATAEWRNAMALGGRVAAMFGGRLRQVASAQEIYDRPADLDVAAFFGEPPMNVFPVGALDLGRRVGVRPERLRLLPAGPKTDGAFGATVESVEPLGAETIVRVALDLRGLHVAVRETATSNWRPGDRAQLIADMSHAVLFDN